jgi:hypothetical protein
MSEHKEVGWFGKSSRPAEKSHWATSLALGALIAATSFMLVLSAVAWFMPKFFLIMDSRWAPALRASLLLLIICVNGLALYRRPKRHQTSGKMPKS